MKNSSRRFLYRHLRFHALGERMKTASFKKLLAATIGLVAATSAVSTALAQATYDDPYAITTFAGLAGAPGSADGTGSAARFNFPFGVAVDGAGNVYVGDQNNS